MAAEQYAQAQSAFEAFLQRFPKHDRAAQARAQAAVALARQDRAADAVAAIAGLEKQGARDLRPEALANLQYEKAWSLRELGQTDAAAKAYQEVLDNAATAPELAAHARLELAQIHFESKDYQAAADLLRTLRDKQADDSGPVSPDLVEQAAYYLASSEFELGRFDEAARLFEEFLDGFPNSELRPPASLCCGEALLQCGRHERAVKHLRLVVDEFPSDPACEPAMLRLGDCLAALQRWSRSERVLTEHLDRFGQSDHWFQAQFGVGWARENQKRYDEAIAAYQKVTEGHQGPTAARAQFQIGECLYAQDQLDQAVSELLKVDILYAYPEWSAASLYEAGRCFEELRKTAEARQQFETVARKYPDSKWSTLASQRLASMADDSLPGR
jgi:TolA-binding protein